MKTGLLQKFIIASLLNSSVLFCPKYPNDHLYYKRVADHMKRNERKLCLFHRKVWLVSPYQCASKLQEVPRGCQGSSVDQNAHYSRECLQHSYAAGGLAPGSDKASG